MSKKLLLFALFAALVGGFNSLVIAQDQDPEPIAFSVAEDSLTLNAPGEWTKVQPRINFIEAEFSIPKEEGDPKNGRLTVMGAGGSIQANIDRWYGQFTQPDGSDTSESAKVEEMTIKGMTVHMVDISGTFLDASGGPFNPNAKKVERDNYRMLAAIIQTADNGNYFVKLYGPQATMKKHEEGFTKMIKELEVVE